MSLRAGDGERESEAALASENRESNVGGWPMFLNLKDENSGRVAGSDKRLVSDVAFGGGIGKLDDVAAAEKPFMNRS